MIRILMIFSLAAIFSSTIGDASKCDKRIISKIRERFWNKCNCNPRELLKLGAFLTPELVLTTTKSYYPNEDKITCLYSRFEGSLVELYIQYENSTSAEGPTSVLDLTEDNGDLIEKEKGIHRYHLYADRFGVTAFYKCSKTGKKGQPEGLIKARARGYDKDAVTEAIRDLASLGIKVNKNLFGESCAPKS